jgi:hypothetical protein
MWLVEGTQKGKKIRKQGLTSVSIKNKNITIEGHTSKKLEDIVSVDVISQEVKTTTGGGVKGAGAGAVLGFLIAGPIGTAVGAGMGSKSKQQGRDNTTIAIGFINGDALICENAEKTDIGKLKVALSQNLISNNSQEGMPKSNSANKKKQVQKNPGLKRPKKLDSKILNYQQYMQGEEEAKIGLKKAYGRKDGDTIKLPNLDFLKKWEKIDGCDPKALELFKSNLAKDIEDYNNFKWLYSNAGIELEGEFDDIALLLITTLIAHSNELKSLEDRILKRDIEEKKLEDKLQILSSSLEGHKKELAEAGFFSKGDIKKKVLSTEEEIKGIKSEIAGNNKTRTSNQNRFNSKPFKIYKTINEPIMQFELIFSKIFPQKKKPKKGSISYDKYSENGHFLHVYQQHFDEIWDKRIEEDKQKRAKENQATKKHEDEKEKELKIDKKQEDNRQDLSIKDRLAELQQLKDQDVISNEEFEISRKRILESL